MLDIPSIPYDLILTGGLFMANKPPKDKAIEFGADVPDDDDEELKAIEATLEGTEITVELTEDEKVKLEAEARMEVAKALKAAKMKDFKAAAKKRLQAEAMFRNGKDDSGEDLATIELHMASYPKWITLDGVRYYSGRKYTKRKSVIAVLQDQMDRGWRQEAARMGERTEWVEQKQKLLSRNGLQMH